VLTVEFNNHIRKLEDLHHDTELSIFRTHVAGNRVDSKPGLFRPWASKSSCQPPRL